MCEEETFLPAEKLVFGAIVFPSNKKSSLHLKYKQTQNTCITFVQRRPKFFDVVSTLYKVIQIYVLCLLGGWKTETREHSLTIEA